MAKRKQARSAKSAAAKKGWETRRKREQEASRKLRARRKAAKKGWVTRRAKAFVAEGMHPQSAHDWATLSPRDANLLEAHVDLSLGLYGTDRGRDRVNYVRGLIEFQNEKFQQVIRRIERQTGISASQIRTAFFSPRAIKL